MDITAIYNHLKTLNLAKSQRHFSMVFLSKNPSYLSMLNATERQPSTNALIHLSQHLSIIAETSAPPLAQHISSLSEQALKEALNKKTVHEI